MNINDYIIEDVKRWARSRGYDVIRVEVNDTYVLAVCNKGGQRVIMELPKSMFN